jgi:hypothetical protein
MHPVHTVCIHRIDEQTTRNALAHRDRGSAWGGKGDRDRALSDFELALRIDPGNPAIFTDRASTSGATVCSIWPSWISIRP